MHNVALLFDMILWENVHAPSEEKPKCFGRTREIFVPKYVAISCGSILGAG